MRLRNLVSSALMLGLASTVAFAQQRFELIVPGSGLASYAERSNAGLRIEDGQGNVTVYQRAPQFDTGDGLFLGFSSAAARQVIRWPAGDQGRMRIATESAPAPLTFRPSQMEIRPLGPVVPSVPLRDIEPRSAYRLLPMSPAGGGRTLGTDRDGNLTMSHIADDDFQAWHLASLAPGLFRIHSDARGRRWSLAGRPDDSLRLVRTSDSVDQLWQIMTVPGEPGSLVLANVGTAMPPKVLACDTAGRVVMRARNWSAGQMWRLVKLNRPLPAVFAEYAFVSREVRPNPPLPPVQVEFHNSHSRELWVLLVDRYAADAGSRIILPASHSKIMSLDRDAGATLVEIYERGLPTGAVQRDEFVTPLPPAARYDVSVYELIVQSIAIDRTVPGGKVDDVQYAPKSLGWFELPPGPLLPDGPFDIYSVSKAQNNPGQVRRIDPAQWQSRADTPHPVESLLDKFQKKPVK